jgi:N-acetylmuramoyl-L-alanine amidase
MFYQLQMVIVVAFLVATLFTAWTPASLLPGNISDRLAQAFSARSTQPAGALEVATPTIPTKPEIGLVVGHWDDQSKDPGAVCPDGLTEFQVNQEIATRVQEALSKHGYQVDLLKEFDSRLDGYNGLVLISIHTDSCQYINDDATGYKVAAALSNRYPERAYRLMSCLIDRYGKTTGLRFNANTVTNDMTSYHAFDEINPETNAVIIELGFLNLDRQILTKNPDKVATGIVNGVLCYVNNESVESPLKP